MRKVKSETVFTNNWCSRYRTMQYYVFHILRLEILKTDIRSNVT